MSSALCQMPQGFLVMERVAQQGPAWSQRLRDMPFIAVAGKKAASGTAHGHSRPPRAWSCSIRRQQNI